MPNENFNDRTLSQANDKALPKPQIQIIVDGKSVFKPGVKTYFVEDDAKSADEHADGKIVGTYCSCDTVVSTHLICTCESVSSGCSCLKYSPVSGCPTNKTGGGVVCTCQSVSCGSPCACIPVVY